MLLNIAIIFYLQKKLIILMIINNTIIIINIINALIAANIVAAKLAPIINPKTTAKVTNNIPSIYSPQQCFFLGLMQQISSQLLFSIIYTSYIAFNIFICKNEYYVNYK